MLEIPLEECQNMKTFIYHFLLRTRYMYKLRPLFVAIALAVKMSVQFFTQV
jgi:hypothetical protein